MVTRVTVRLIFIVSLLSVPGVCQSPTTPQRDPQALTIVNQVIKVTGGITNVSAVQDINGSGTVTFNWSDEGVPRTATVKGRGSDQFRLDVSFPDGPRTWAVSRGIGFEKDVDGSVTPIPYYNAINFGSLTFPVAHLLAALQDSSLTVSYIGVEALNQNSAYHIQIQKTLPSSQDPTGRLSKLTRIDYFVDPATFYIVAMRGMTHPRDQLYEDHALEVDFSNYQQIGGIVAPLSITEISDRQTAFTIQLSQVTFNAGLTDADFSQ
jgi:hypothetical protein